MNLYRRLLYIFIAIFLHAPFTESADINEALEEFRRFAAQQMKADQVPGMVIGYMRWDQQNETTWVEAFGYSDLENKIPATYESAFRLGSVSKPMTAAAVLLLAQQRKIDLDAEVQTYVPYFPRKKFPITVKQLLGHLGGISHYKNYEVEGRIKERKSTREAIAIFEGFDLVAEPGTKYSYSSYGYNLLAAVVEGASKERFGKFMEQKVWHPLGMKNTRLDDPADLIPNRVRGYRIRNGEIKNSEFIDVSSRFGAGGTRSTVPDMLRFARGVVQGRILNPESMKFVYSSFATRDGHFVDYTAGWGIRTTNGHFILRHTGSQAETATVLLCFPALKFAIACAINQEDAGASVFATRLYELITNERWGLTAYVTNQKSSYRAISSVFEAGLSHYELHGKPFTNDQAELAQAFDYFRRSVSTDDAKVVDAGRHIVSEQSYVKVGSHMAKVLTDHYGHKRLNVYHASGPIPFFADYLQTCALKPNKSACEFPDSFRRLVSQWHESWGQTATPEIVNLRLEAQSDLDETGRRLQTKFSSRVAYPDYSRELSDLTWSFLLKGKYEKSLKVGEIGLSLYPESARHLALYGISLVAVSDKNRGLNYLRKAYKLDPESPAEPDWLTDFAEELATSGKIEEAMKIMTAAVELYPREPQVLNDMGEAYLHMKDSAKAKFYFEKALSLDPKDERAKSKLKEISKP